VIFITSQMLIFKSSLISLILITFLSLLLLIHCVMQFVTQSVANVLDPRTTSRSIKLRENSKVTPEYL
jgi:hypothetical protein